MNEANEGSSDRLLSSMALGLSNRKKGRKEGRKSTTDHLGRTWCVKSSPELRGIPQGLCNCLRPVLDLSRHDLAGGNIGTVRNSDMPLLK